MRSPTVGNNCSGLQRNRHIATASGADRTSGSLLQDGLFLCGPRGVTNIITPHQLVGAVPASPFRSDSLVTSLPRERTYNIEVGSFDLVPIGPLFPGSLSSHLRAGASAAINTARPGLPHILSGPTEVHTRTLELHRRPRSQM